MYNIDHKRSIVIYTDICKHIAWKIFRNITVNEELWTDIKRYKSMMANQRSARIKLEINSCGRSIRSCNKAVKAIANAVHPNTTKRKTSSVERRSSSTGMCILVISFRTKL